MHLRDYQQECLATIRERYLAGTRRQLVCLPTGTGKTVIFAQFPRFFKIKHRMLVLAHREELLEQAAAKLREAQPDLRVEIEQAGRRASPEANVVVAGVATLGRKDTPRLTRLDPDEFHLIVVDEAHHAAAESWRRILDHFGVFDPDSRKLLVGFTATPKRSDGAGLDQVFEDIVFSRDLPGMIDQGYLSPVAAYRVETDVDLTGVRTRMGDFVTGQLSLSVNTSERNALIAKVYASHLSGKQTVCFCVDVAHAEGLAAAFAAHGVRARSISGETSRGERQKTLNDFRKGELQVVTNCMVLTEGYDEPSIEGIILARPTRSTGLYTQMIGRGTRLHEGKREVVIIDIVDVTRGHHLVTLPALFGFSDRFDLEGKTTTELEKIVRWVERRRPWVRVDDARSISELRHRCRRVDLLALATPSELSRGTSFAWISLGNNGYTLPLGGGEVLTASPTLLDSWEVTLRRPGSVGHRPTTVAAGGRAMEAVSAAEDYIRSERPDALRLVERKLRWRREPPTEKQEEILHRHKLELPAEMTRGDASRLISMLPR